MVRVDSAALQKMHIPQHITVTGDHSQSQTFDDAEKAWAEKEKVAAMMSVPEKIVIAGGDVHSVRRSAPHEMVVEQMLNEANRKDESALADLPLTIKLDEQPYMDTTEPINRHEESMSQASIAIEENPLQELKLMRRQLTKVSTRLYQLEDDLERRRGRDVYYGGSIIGLAAFIVFLFLRR